MELGKKLLIESVEIYIDMTLASYISCLRIVLIVPIIYLLHLGEGHRSFGEGTNFYFYFAFSLFVIAGLTVYFDVYIAR